MYVAIDNQTDKIVGQVVALRRRTEPLRKVFGEPKLVVLERDGYRELPLWSVRVEKV